MTAMLVWRAGLSCALSLGACLGCGSNAPELPPELVDKVKSIGTGDAGSYPPGPYGTREGEVARNLCFEGWQNPLEANYDPARLEQICFADFYDPAGAAVEILLVNTGALWCTACKTEWGGSASRASLPDYADQRGADGLRVLGIFFQDDARRPASVEVIQGWARTFSIDVPFARDPDFLMDAFADSGTQPFNMLLDARTMKILLQVEGDQPEVLLARVERELDARAGR